MQYPISADEYATVHYGNTLKPTHAKNQPEVNFDPNIKLFSGQKEGETLWTLVLTNPDSHLKDNTKEYCHWFV